MPKAIENKPVRHTHATSCFVAPNVLVMTLDKFFYLFSDLANVCLSGVVAPETRKKVPADFFTIERRLTVGHDPVSIIA